MIFTAAEVRQGRTENGYVLLFSQADLDAQPLRAVVIDADGEACQKEKIASPFRNMQTVPRWYIAGREEPQPPTLPAALIWEPGMISARLVQARS